MNVSVVIPAFNAEKTIRETIKSVLNQSVKGFEIIVVNDGSTDCTGQILKGFGKRLIVLGQENKGISSARNAGAKKASSELIAFLDADVVVEKKWLEKMVKAFEEEKDLFAVSGRPSMKPVKSLAENFFCFTVSESEFQGYNVAFNKEKFLELGGFNEKMRYAEDPELIWKAFNSGLKMKTINALSFHKPYGFRERLKANLKYAFFDGILLKKNFSRLISKPFDFMKRAPKNIKGITGFYSLLFASWAACGLGIAFSGNWVFLLFVFLNPLVAFVKILSSRIKFSRNTLAVAGYGFLAVFLIGLVKGFSFLGGALVGNRK